MKKIILDVLNSKVRITDVAIEAGDSGSVGFVVENVPYEWKSGDVWVYALFKRGQFSQINRLEEWETDVPSGAMADNNAFKTVVFAVKNTEEEGKYTYRYVASPVWVRVGEGLSGTIDAEVIPDRERIDAIATLLAAMQKNTEKVDGIEDGAEVNVQSDWSETNEDSDSFIKNKPTIDQSYNPDSENAQSGTAVKEAVAQGVAQGMAEIVGGAPEMLDTLKEIADALDNDENAYQTIMSVITTNIDELNDALKDKLSMSDVDINLNTESYKPVANAAVSSAVDDLFHQVNDNCLKKGEAHEIYTPRSEFNETTTDIRFEIEALKNNGAANGFDIQYLDKASTSFKDYVSGDANTPAKILRSGSGGKGILLSCYTENEVDGFAGTTGFLIDMDGRMYKRRDSRFTGKPEHDWEEIVTGSDIVRSIESSLDEIIKKYGLGGESV